MGFIFRRYFNPRSHEGSDILKLSFAPCAAISIHAPTRGATIKSLKKICQLRNFNPRSHEGSDGLPGQRPDESNVISIHAPTRGATGTHPRNTCHQNYFNPRSHEGSDQDHRSRQTGTDKFQSTLPRGERPFNWILRRFMSVFQSTLPRGERQYQGL